MEKYHNYGNNSNIRYYECGSNYIKILFQKKGMYDLYDCYLYTNDSATKDIIDRMKQIASEGKGLSRFISKITNNHRHKIQADVRKSVTLFDIEMFKGLCQIR